MHSRRVGLSRYQPVRHLLQSVETSQSEITKKPSIEPAVDDPPLDDDRSESDNGVSNASNRGDIRPTSFKATGQDKLSPFSGARWIGKRKRQTVSPGKQSSPEGSGPQTGYAKHVSRRNGIGSTSSPSSQRKAKRNTPEEDDPSSSPQPGTKMKAASGNPIGSQHDGDLFGPPRKIVAGYGNTKVKTYGKSHISASPKRVSRPVKGQPDPGMSSPRRKPLAVPVPSSNLAAEPTSPPRKLRGFPISTDWSSKKISPRKRLKDPRQVENRHIEDTPEESQRPMLKIPGLSSAELDLDADEEPLLDFAGSPLRMLTRPMLSPTEHTTPTSSRPTCPMCNEEVDKDLLDSFKEKHPRITLHQEQKFCLLHRRNSAKEAWVAKGYPDIKWNALDSRITRKHGFLRTILEGSKSHYGEIFSQKVKAGQNKTLLRSEDNLTPGYYGIRGLRAMSENLVREFSLLLRKRAVQDRLVSARGYTAYVQAVLVPELAVQLIMEDMSVDAEEARSIMKESIWVGELLNEEVADVVLSENDDDDGSLSELSSVLDIGSP